MGKVSSCCHCYGSLQIPDPHSVFDRTMCSIFILGEILKSICVSRRHFGSGRKWVKFVPSCCNPVPETCTGGSPIFQNRFFGMGHWGGRGRGLQDCSGREEAGKLCSVPLWALRTQNIIFVILANHYFMKLHYCVFLLLLYCVHLLLSPRYSFYREMRRMFTFLNPKTDANSFWPGHLLDKLRLYLPHAKREEGQAVFSHISCARPAYPGMYHPHRTWPISEQRYVTYGDTDFRKYNYYI